MSDLSLALPPLFKQEGHETNNPDDPGGITNYGISLRFLKQTGELEKDWLDDVDADHYRDINAFGIELIKKMTPQEAGQFYDKYFWSKYGYSRINDQKLANKVLSLSVNMGPAHDHRCLQHAINDVGRNNILVDGILGDKTIAAINSLDSVKLLAAFKLDAANYYRAIRLKNGNEAEFIKGWINRVYY